MLERIVKSVEELNVVALHLRQNQDLDAIRELAKAWAVSYQDTENFIYGRRYRLAEVPIADKDFKFASEKLREEMLALDDKYFASIIGWYITRKSSDDEELAAQVLRKHKSLQRCLDFISGKAFEMATEQAKQKGLDRIQENTGLAITEKEVFPWAEEYYRREDEDTVKETEAEEKKKILSMWEFMEKKPVDTGKVTSMKKVGAGKAKKAPKKANKSADTEKQEETKVAKTEEKKETFGQMSLFDLAQ